MSIVDGFVKDRILSTPNFYATRGEVLHYVLCVFGHGYDWVDGVPVSDNVYIDPAWSVEVARARWERFYGTNESESVSTRVEAEKRIVDNIDEFLTSWDIERFTGQSRLALISNVPEDIHPDWAVEIEKLKVILEDEGGWEF